MKTSQEEGVSNRPPTPTTCPDMRRRRSTPAVGVGSAQSGSVQASSDTRVAPYLLPYRRRALSHCHRGRRRNEDDQRLRKPPSIIVAAFVDDLGTLSDRCPKEDVDRLRVRATDVRDDDDTELPPVDFADSPGAEIRTSEAARGSANATVPPGIRRIRLSSVAAWRRPLQPPVDQIRQGAQIRRPQRRFFHATAS
jgi:hypothetical protein